MHTNSGHRNIVECGGEVTFEIEAQGLRRTARCDLWRGYPQRSRQPHPLLHTRYHSGFTFDGEKKATFKAASRTCR
jgi:hypothetical protein